MNKMIIVVSGGVIQKIISNVGIKVEIRDYDVNKEGDNDPDFNLDHEGFEVYSIIEVVSPTHVEFISEG